MKTTFEKSAVFSRNYKYISYFIYDDWKVLSNIFHEIHNFVLENKDMLFMELCLALEEMYNNKKSRSRANIFIDTKNRRIQITRLNKSLPSMVIESLNF